MMALSTKRAKVADSVAGPSAEQQLASFLRKFTVEVASLAESILATMRALYPTANLLVYDNYNALAIGFAPGERTSHGIFSIAVFPKWVSLFFLQARGLPDPDGILQGDGSVARHIRLPSAAKLDELPVRTLMQEATARAVIPFAAKGNSRLIIKSISAKQRPRRPAK
jgi:hypothetical protein